MRKGEEGKQRRFEAWWPSAQRSALGLLTRSRLPELLKVCFDSPEPDFGKTLRLSVLPGPRPDAGAGMGLRGVKPPGSAQVTAAFGTKHLQDTELT